MSGYTDSHGSLCNQQMIGFFARSKDVYSDNRRRPLLVSRARYLNIVSTISRSLHDCLTRGVIGSGIRLEFSKEDMFSEELESYDILSSGIKKQFERASALHMFDSHHELTFTQFETLVFYTMLVSGECWLFRSNEGCEWSIKEPDYIKTPSYFASSVDGDVVRYEENLIIDGIEVTKLGKPVAVWFCLDPYSENIQNDKTNYTRIPFCDENGLPLILHLYIKERPEQMRGLPLTAPVIQNIWSVLAFMESETQMAILQTNSALIVTQNSNPTVSPFASLSMRELNAPLIPSSEDTSKSSDDFTIFPPMGNNIMDGFIEKTHFIQPGCSHHLTQGEDIKFLTPTAPSTNLISFVDLQVRQIGAALGIPEQVLSGKFDSNFSAVKGSVSAFNHTIKKFRKVFIESFLRPFLQMFCFECGLDEETSLLLSCSAQWLPNDSPLVLDPNKEIEFYLKAIEGGLITKSEAAQALFGHNDTSSENKEGISSTVQGGGSIDL